MALQQKQLLNFFGISKEISYVIEDNILKQGKFIPGVNIEIKSKNKINNRIDNLLVLAWNFFDDIKKNNNQLSKNILNIKDLEKSKNE